MGIFYDPSAAAQQITQVSPSGGVYDLVSKGFNLSGFDPATVLQDFDNITFRNGAQTLLLSRTGDASLSGPGLNAPEVTTDTLNNAPATPATILQAQNVASNAQASTSPTSLLKSNEGIILIGAALLLIGILLV